MAAQRRGSTSFSCRTRLSLSMTGARCPCPPIVAKPRWPPPSPNLRAGASLTPGPHPRGIIADIWTVATTLSSWKPRSTCRAPFAPRAATTSRSMGSRWSLRPGKPESCLNPRWSNRSTRTGSTGPIQTPAPPGLGRRPSGTARQGTAYHSGKAWSSGSSIRASTGSTRRLPTRGTMVSTM